MPSKAKRLGTSGRRLATPRKSSAKRGYDRHWRKVRKLKLQLDPLCQDCEAVDVTMPAVDVHHIRKVVDFPELRLCLDNLRSLCKSCHSRRTARGE